MRAHTAARAVCTALAATLVFAAPAAATTFGAPTIVANTGGEPGINVGNDGAIYVNAPAGFLSHLPGSASNIYKSTNGGQSFALTPPGLRANLPGGGDSNLAVDPVSGALYFTDLWLGSATVSASTDGAQTWTANPLQGVVVQDRQWVASSGNGTVYHVTHQIPLGLVVSKSMGGVVFPFSTVAASVADQTGCVCPPGNLVAEGAGGLFGSDHVGFLYPTSTGGIKFAGSSNGALTFTNVAVALASSDTTNANFPVLASAGDGRHLVAVWMAETGSASVVRIATSADWGASWSAPRGLVGSGTSVYPWVAASGSKVAVSLYHNASVAATPDTAPAGSQWFETYLESADGGATFSALQTVDPTAVKSGPICTAGTGCSANRELLDFQTVTLNQTQLGAPPDVVWTRSVDNVRTTELRFAHG